MTEVATDRTKKVLVVDDEIAIAQSLRLILEEEDGIEVLVAYGGQEALAMVHRERPQLVLSDVMMPVLDGPELCRRLRADPATSRIAIVLMSATHGRDVGEYGADGFIAKPFDLGEVFETVDRLLT